MCTQKFNNKIRGKIINARTKSRKKKLRLNLEVRLSSEDKAPKDMKNEYED